MTTDWNTYDVLGIGADAWTDEETLYSLKTLAGAKPQRVLELGCGRGKLLRCFPAEVRYGIDPSESAIQKAASLDPTGVYEVGSATHLPYPDKSFSLLYSAEVIEHIEDYDLFLKEASRVLQPGGRIYIQTPNYPVKRLYDWLYFLLGRKATWRDDYTHVSKFSTWKLARSVSTYFVIDDVYVRNILGEGRFSLLKKFHHSLIGRMLGQKTIVIAHAGDNAVVTL